jgi:hypothetical protein
MDDWERQAANGSKAAQEGAAWGDKIPAQANATAWARGRRAPSGPRAGFHFWAASTMMIFNVFSIFSEAFSIKF